MDFWWVPFQTQLLKRLTEAAHLAASLLCYLFHEPLDHGRPVHDVPHLCWCVL